MEPRPVRDTAPPDAPPAASRPARLRCLWCGHEGPRVEVHGHAQCARCGTNVDPCCGGERAVPPGTDGDR